MNLYDTTIMQKHILNQEMEIAKGFDPKTGEVHIDSPAFRIGPGLTMKQFLGSPLAVLTRGGPHSNYQFCPVTMDGEQWGFVVYYQWGELWQVTFGIAGSGFDTSYEREIANKKFHEQWMQKTIGSPLKEMVPCINDPETAMMGCDFPWGWIASVYSGQTGESSIQIRYKITESQD